MRHRIAGRKLNRSGGHRKALFRNLITELFRHERIQTTEAKARSIRGKAEPSTTAACSGTRSSGGRGRRALAVLRRAVRRASRQSSGNPTGESKRNAETWQMHEPGQTSLTVCRPAAMRTVHCFSHPAVLVRQLPVTPANPRCTFSPST